MRGWCPADDVECRRSLRKLRRDEHGSTEETAVNGDNKGHELEVQKFVFVKINVRGFQYKPRGDWFSFAVNKTWFSQD